MTRTCDGSPARDAHASLAAMCSCYASHRSWVGVRCRVCVCSMDYVLEPRCAGSPCHQSRCAVPGALALRVRLAGQWLLASDSVRLAGRSLSCRPTASCGRAIATCFVRAYHDGAKCQLGSTGPELWRPKETLRSGARRDCQVQPVRRVRRQRGSSGPCPPRVCMSSAQENTDYSSMRTAAVYQEPATPSTSAVAAHIIDGSNGTSHNTKPHTSQRTSRTRDAHRT